MNELYVKEKGIYYGFLTEMVTIDLKGKIIAKNNTDDKYTIDLNVDVDNNASVLGKIINHI